MHTAQLHAKSISTQRIRFSSTWNVQHLHENRMKYRQISIFVTDENNAQNISSGNETRIFTVAQLSILVLMYDFYQYQNKNAWNFDINMCLTRRESK